MKPTFLYQTTTIKNQFCLGCTRKSDSVIHTLTTRLYIWRGHFGWWPFFSLLIYVAIIIIIINHNDGDDDDDGDDGDDDHDVDDDHDH